MICLINSTASMRSAGVLDNQYDFSSDSSKTEPTEKAVLCTAGKTTFAKILSTLLRPTSGYAEVCGNDVTLKQDEVTRTAYWKKLSHSLNDSQDNGGRLNGWKSHFTSLRIFDKEGV